MIAELQTPAILVSGNVLLTLGFLSTLGIHFRLGREWRSGIDPGGPRHLISSGVYGFSRNPMFLSVAISQLGFFLAIPSLFSLVCLLVGLYTLHSQALAEETHLVGLFPEDYRDYASRVRRWI